MGDSEAAVGLDGLKDVEAGDKPGKKQSQVRSIIVVLPVN